MNDIQAIFDLVGPFFRRKRMQLFLRCLSPVASQRILDVGGYHFNWGDDPPCQVTCLNIHKPEDLPDSNGRFIHVVGDARRLPFADKSFDIGFSNSVIEHVGTYEDQRRFAAEITRVCKRVFVQTPNRWFFIEPHFITPFIHYLPRPWQRRLVRHFTIWGLVTRPTPDVARTFLDSICQLTRREMEELFPDCQLHEERFFLLTKSFVAVTPRW